MANQVMTRTEALSVIATRIKGIKGHRAILPAPFILRHGLLASEFYLDGASQQVYYVRFVEGEIEQESYLLENQSDFVLNRVADVLKHTKKSVFKDNLKFARQFERDCLELREMVSEMCAELGVILD